MERKLAERRIILYLVILLVIEIGLLGLHLGFGGFRWSMHTNKAGIAGSVARSENELRRRGNSSLVWEKSGADDVVYFYDSILTLSQSTASLKLYRDTEVKLSENTLVTIEPQDKRGAGGEIRLKFVKGNLKARNPFVNTRVESDTWSMEIKSGSDVDVRQVGEGFELEVTKGEVDFKSATGVTKVASSEVLKIKENAAEKIAIDEALRWADAPPARIYTHQDGETVKLRWQSEAKELVVQSLGRGERTVSLEGRTEHDLPLPLGRHQIFLRNQQKTSPALSVEIWKAPLLHLVSPLPRNRVRTNEPTAFVWMTARDVKSYDLILKGKAFGLRKPLTENTFSTQLDQEDDAEWSVEGKDADGFSIPPLYTYPLYIREAPLAAPKLRSPTLRKPAKEDGRGASFWFLLLPQAFAEELLYQAVFSWEKVEGADRYVIEISETADFRKPLVNVTVNENEFVWKKISLKTYFWRVAAETKGGRMGLFSDPEKVDLKNGDQAGVAVTAIEVPMPPPAKPKPKITFGAEPPPKPVAEELPVHNVVPPPPVEKVEKAPEPVNLSPVPELPPREERQLKPHTYVEWTPSFNALSVRAPGNVRGSLTGANPLALSIGADRVFTAGKMARLRMTYARFNFKPQPADRYPDQSNLSWAEISFSAVLHKSSSNWGYGLFLKRGADLVRESDTTVKMNDSNEIGGCVQNLISFGPVQYSGDYIGMVGSNYGLMTRQALRLPAFSGFYFGAQIEGVMLFRSGARSSGFSGQALLGYDF